MKTIVYLLLFIAFSISYAQYAEAYEVQIENGVALDAGPNTYFSNPPKENESLFSWLGGAENIEKILIGTPYINKSQTEFTEEYVKNRFENSYCINSRKDDWHYAPFTMGTVYLKNGSKINFEMYLSGISIAKHLFAKQ
jgi:hypothetical protein